MPTVLQLPSGPTASAAFAAQHALFVPGAASPAFVGALQALVASAPWAPDPVTGDAFRFDGHPADLAPVAPALLDPALLEALHALTGVDGIRGFEGQLKRIRPGDAFPWHRDHRKGQRLGMSLCLEGDFAGGAFEIRWRWAQEPLFRCQPTAAGDLHLIDVADPRLVHRVTPVTRGARVVLAGWWVG